MGTFTEVLSVIGFVIRALGFAVLGLCRWAFHNGRLQKSRLASCKLHWRLVSLDCSSG